MRSEKEIKQKIKNLQVVRQTSPHAMSIDVGLDLLLWVLQSPDKPKKAKKIQPFDPCKCGECVECYSVKQIRAKKGAAR